VTTMLTPEEYRRAEFGYTVTEIRRGFKIHALVYGIVMAGLSVLNALLWIYGDANFPWAAFPLVGWGIGLTFHYIYGYRRAGHEAHSRQHRVEEYAAREKELV
jgi:hypothetical protein